MQKNVLMSAYVPELEFVLGMKYEPGKVRENYSAGDKRIMITTDRISAFDVVMRQGIPSKGAALNGISLYWFNNTKDIVQNHINDVIDPVVWSVKQCDPLPIEVIVRGYLAGSMAADYEKGKREKSGVKLPDGLVRNQKLDEPIITPTTKAALGQHDMDISREYIIDKGLVTAETYKQIEEVALRLFSRGKNITDGQKLIIVDTKYEFGLKDGELVLTDEIHTPDSSRYWEHAEYDKAMEEGRDPKQLSKEFLRDELRAMGFSGQNQHPPDLPDELVKNISERYTELYTRVTGLKLEKETVNAGQRVINALREHGYIKGSFVSIIAGSEKDSDHYNKITERLPKTRAAHVFHYSAHKDAEQLLPLLKKLENSLEPLAIITVAGRSNALGGFVAGNMKNKRPVINCPAFADMTAYSVDIHSSMRMPSNVPVATVVDPANAAYYADVLLSEVERLTA